MELGGAQVFVVRLRVAQGFTHSGPRGAIPCSSLGRLKRVCGRMAHFSHPLPGRYAELTRLAERFGYPAAEIPEGLD